MKINTEQTKLINNLINHKLKDYLYLTECDCPLEFYEKYKYKTDAIRFTDQIERKKLEKLFKFKERLLELARVDNHCRKL
jgi:hypothetical protein